jgi:hypothetical protein
MSFSPGSAESTCSKASSTRALPGSTWLCSRILFELCRKLRRLPPRPTRPTEGKMTTTTVESSE